MLALFLNHPPLFVAGEIALGLSLALFAGALIAAVIRGALDLSVARNWPSKCDECSSVFGRSGLPSYERSGALASGDEAGGSTTATTPAVRSRPRSALRQGSANF